MEWLALAAVAAFVGFGWFAFAGQIGRLRHTPLEAAALIDAYLAGQVEDAVWQRFLTVRAIDPRVEDVRRACLEASDLHVTARSSQPRLDPEGQELLRELALRLRRETS